MQAQLAEHSQRYLRVRLFHSVPLAQMVRNVDSEHRDLMQALLDRDAPRAAKLMQEHLEATASTVASLWKTELGKPAPSLRATAR
jgi:DNA-binding GntR family transcriptional regulator